MKIPVILIVRAQGKDGAVEGRRRAYLPCTPFDGLWVDGLRVQKVNLLTADKDKEPAWELTLQGYTQIHGDARRNLLALIGDDKGWTIAELKTQAPADAE